MDIQSRAASFRGAGHAAGSIAPSDPVVFASRCSGGLVPPLPGTLPELQIILAHLFAPLWNSRGPNHSDDSAARRGPLAFWSRGTRTAPALLNPSLRYAIDFRLGLCPLTDSKQSEAQKSKIAPVQIQWTSVTYKTVAIYVILIFGIVMLALYVIFPDWTPAMVRRATNAMAGAGDSAPSPTLTQARFVNLDGKVQVKKVNSVTWNNADYRITLDKGDLIQTGTDGVARLTFADGTTYTVKPETLITVEE